MGNEAGSDDGWLQERRYCILSCFQHGVATAPAALVQCAANRVQGARGRASPGADRAMPSTMEREVCPMGERRRGRSKAVDRLSSGRIRIHDGRESARGCDRTRVDDTAPENGNRETGAAINGSITALLPRNHRWAGCAAHENYGLWIH